MSPEIVLAIIAIVCAMVSVGFSIGAMRQAGKVTRATEAAADRADAAANEAKALADEAFRLRDGL